jgi:hypothetical protein
MNPIWRYPILGFILLPFITDVRAECEPKDFTISDINSSSFSNVVKYSGYSTVDSSKQENKDTKIDGSAFVKGAKFTLGIQDAKSLSEHILSSSGYDYSSDTRQNIFRSALSQIGKEMYDNCIALRRLKVAVPDTAWTQSKFRVTTTWEPGGMGAPPSTNLTISTIGGTVEGKEKLTRKVQRGQPNSFLIERKTIDGQMQLLQIDMDAYDKAIPTILSRRRRSLRNS